MTWKSYIPLGIIVLIILLLMSIFFFANMSTSMERAEDFCERNGMIFGFYKGAMSCVKVSETRVVERKIIVYVNGIKDWRFKGSWERLNVD